MASGGLKALAAPGEGTRQQGPPAPCDPCGRELPLEREKHKRGISQRKRETKNSSHGEEGPFALLGPLARSLPPVSDWAK